MWFTILCNGYIHFYVKVETLPFFGVVKKLFPPKGKQFKNLGRKKLPLFQCPEFTLLLQNAIFLQHMITSTAVQMLNI